jgi:hypothetical protein
MMLVMIRPRPSPGKVLRLPFLDAKLQVELAPRHRIQLLPCDAAVNHPERYVSEKGMYC